MENWPIFVMLVMIVLLLIKPSGMVTVCPVAALVVLVLSGSEGPDLVAHAAPATLTVLVVMSATQLAIRGILQGGAGDWLSVAIAGFAAHPTLRRVPATVLLPAILIPASMVLAMFLHNITSLLVLTPLALTLCARYQVRPEITLSGMLIGSNLGGASMAFGDTPAIIQRQLWGFTPATFAMAMLPRNLIVLLLLTGAACAATWYPERHRITNWFDTLKRLRTRDDITASIQFAPDRRKELLVGLFALTVFILLQFLYPRHALVSGAAVLAVLVLLTPAQKRVEAFTTLGLEAILVICALFILAAAVERTPLIHILAEHLKAHRGNGAIEITAYCLTAAISADGAAAALAPIVHNLSGGSMGSAWELASGICAGSSVLLTAASAGPIINAISRGAGHELTFRTYARYGVAFSALMLAVYLVFNRIAGG